MSDRPLHGQTGDLGPLYAALAGAQAILRSAAEDGQNPHFRSTYATLDSCWTAARAALAGSGVAVLQFPLTLPDGHWGIETRLGHASGCELWRTWVLPSSGGGRGNPLQAAGANLSLARRYALCAFLGITTGDDTDGEPASPQQVQQRQAPALAAPAAPAAPVKPSTSPQMKRWTADHHKSWAADRANFCRLLSELGADYLAIKGWCISLGRAKPSAMPPGKRAKVVEHLRGLDAADLAIVLERGNAQAARCES
jgi:hypothetical protein